jgi:hypothetical protein
MFRDSGAVARGVRPGSDFQVPTVTIARLSRRVGGVPQAPSWSGMLLRWSTGWQGQISPHSLLPKITRRCCSTSIDDTESFLRINLRSSVNPIMCWRVVIMYGLVRAGQRGPSGLA